jgi:hypothetical protein
MKYFEIVNYRYLVFVMLSLILVDGAMSQSKEECGTVPSEEYLDYLAGSSMEREALVEKYNMDRQMGRVENTNIAIQFHISRTSEGDDASVSEADLLQVVENMNAAFSPMGMSFMPCGQTKFIDDDILHTSFDRNLHNYRLDQYDDHLILNIYFFPDIVGADGFAYLPSAQIDRIVLIGRIALTSSLIHELGHYFALLHTYATARGDELVSGDNCRVAGDSICDTPPDPGDRGYFSDCIYSGTVTDAAGDKYDPDGFNYMGKGNRSCRNRFSPLQQERILGSLLMDRHYLVDCSQTAAANAECIATITTFPYEESFEDYTGGSAWRQNVDDDFGWRSRHETVTDNTGPDHALTGDYFMFAEASDNNDDIGILSSPCFNLENRMNASFSFGYHMYGKDMGELELQISEDEGTTWVSLWAQQGDKGNQWNVEIITLDDYIGHTIQLRFVGRLESGSKGDMAIDDVVVLSEEIITGVEQVNDIEVLNVYPNPAGAVLNIQFPELGQHPATLHIIGLDGRIVYEEILQPTNADLNRSQLDIAHFEAGVYLVHIIGQSTELISSFVHQP